MATTKKTNNRLTNNCQQQIAADLRSLKKPIVNIKN